MKWKIQPGKTDTGVGKRKFWFPVLDLVRGM